MDYRWLCCFQSLPSTNTTESNAMPRRSPRGLTLQPNQSRTLQGDIQGISLFIDGQIENGLKVVLVTVNYPPLCQSHALSLQDD